MTNSVIVPPHSNDPKIGKESSKTKKCQFCLKKKKVMMTCACGQQFCLAHYPPNLHNCKNILGKKDNVDPSLLTATGEFKKIEKI
tara:strand:+ start:1541 stop:1795 length:255 start_codon:yes stop_codon:yes gene_type:complete